MKFVLKLIFSAVLIMGLAHYLNGVEVDSFQTALIAVLVLSFTNTIIKPIFTLLTFPLTLLSLGLFLIIINILMVFLAAQLVPGFEVNGWITACFFGLVTGTLNSAFANFIDEKKD